MADTVLKGRYHWGKCPIGCGRIVQVDEGKYKTQVRAGGLEYETMGSEKKLDEILSHDLLFDSENCLRYGLVDKII